MTVRLFRSSDIGAPQLSTSNDGSLLTILRACLVDGYGSGGNVRTPAGWTMPFSDIPNGIACFKALNGDYLRLNDGLEYRWASALGFKAMSDKDTGTEQYPTNDQIGVGNQYRLFKRYNAANDYNGWFVIASENWFYFSQFNTTTSPNYPSAFFFGKYSCANPSFTENYLLTGYISAISSASMTVCYNALFSQSYGYYARRNYQNSIYPVPLNLNWNATGWDNPNPFTGSLELEAVQLRDQTSNFIRYGRLPNLSRISGASNMRYRGGETFSAAAKNYVVLAHTSAAFAIEFDVNVG